MAPPPPGCVEAGLCPGLGDETPACHDVQEDFTEGKKAGEEKEKEKAKEDASVAAAAAAPPALPGAGPAPMWKPNNGRGGPRWAVWLAAFLPLPSRSGPPTALLARPSQASRFLRD